MSVKSSFISTQEQVVKLNGNNVSLLLGLNEIVTSKDSHVEMKIVNTDDQVSIINLPTVGYLQSELNRLNQNVKTLSGVDSRGSVVFGANNAFQKIIKADLNKEPNPLGEQDPIDSFFSVPNSFFDALLNPILAVPFDLTGEIDNDTQKIISRRYIIEFQKDEFGELTDQGQDAQNSFNENFKGRTNVTIEELEHWILNTPGILTMPNGNKIVYDQETFTIEPNNLEYDGIFSVLGTQEDRVNNKLWYLFDTLTYYNVKTSEEKQLGIDDELILNTPTTTTRWKIIEISNAASEFRVLLEYAEGYEPVPVGIQGGLKYYSGVQLERLLLVSVGFDEYNVVFLKPINTNNLKARQWSPGTAFYTNDLRLTSSSDTGEDGLSMTDYYINTVQDYGKLLADAAEKEIPGLYGLEPNVTVLDANNFTVVQVNKNITDSDESERLKNLHAQSTTYTSQLEELNKTIVERQNELIKKQFNNPADKTKVENEIKKLSDEANTVSKLLETTVSQIISESSRLPKAEPEFRARGFWAIPESVSDGRSRPQEIIQFRINWRYLSETGQENATESFTITLDDEGDTVNASFSNWQEYITDIRDRTFDVETGRYEWDVEDVTNPDVTNINQLNVPLSPGEKVEVRVKSVSEVSWPTATIESEWSESIIISFPTELVPPANRGQQIVENAKFDNVRIGVEQDLREKGLDTHLSSQFTDNNVYYSHNSDTIGVVTNTGVVRLTERLQQIESSENVEEEKGIEFEEPWVNYGAGYSKATYYKHEARVFLSGLVRVERRFDNEEDDFDYSKRYPDVVVRSGVPTANTEYANIGYLPLQYRPDSIKTFLVSSSIGENTTTNVANNAFPWGRTQKNNTDLMYGRIDIHPNGLIRLVTGATGWISLENVEFRIPKNPLTNEDNVQTENILNLSRLQPGIQTEV